MPSHDLSRSLVHLLSFVYIHPWCHPISVHRELAVDICSIQCELILSEETCEAALSLSLSLLCSVLCHTFVQSLLYFYFVAIFRLHTNICVHTQTRRSFFRCCFCVTRPATLISITIAFCVRFIFQICFYFHFLIRAPSRLKRCAVRFNGFISVNFFIARFLLLLELIFITDGSFLRFSMQTHREWNVVCSVAYFEYHAQ